LPRRIKEKPGISKVIASEEDEAGEDGETEAPADK
jgi:hypothetical protein